MTIARLPLVLCAACGTLVSGQVADPVPKIAGICFRCDDNHTPARWRQLAEIFEAHDAPLCAALNLLRSAHDPAYMAFVKELQERGHEIMDHTPSHSAFSMRFQTPDEAAPYAGQPGVHHVRDGTVCFRYLPPAKLDDRYSGVADIGGKTFATADRERVAKWRSDPFVLFADDPEIYMLDGDGDAPSRLRSFWNEDTVTLPPRQGVRFHMVLRTQIGVDPEALRHQARLVRDICDRHGIRRPVTWIQPGGREPMLHRAVIKHVFGDEFGYKAAAVYPESSLKCFNEFDPDGDRRFAMQWGNFLEDRFDLERNRKLIADGIARHYVMIGHSHMSGAAEIGGLEGYLRNTEALLAWCRAKGIPVRTYSAWADILYGARPDPAFNVFPDPGRDLDEDGIPDGLQLGTGVTVEESTQDGGGAILAATRDGRICAVTDLAGIEKGRNRFSLRLAGPLGAQVQVRFSSRDGAIGGGDLLFEQTQPDWQSWEGIVTVPENASRMTIEILRRDRFEDALRVRDIRFAAE